MSGNMSWILVKEVPSGIHSKRCKEACHRRQMPTHQERSKHGEERGGGGGRTQGRKGKFWLITNEKHHTTHLNADPPTLDA